MFLLSERNRIITRHTQYNTITTIVSTALTLIEHAFKAAAIGSDQCAKSLADSIHPFAFVLLAGHCLDLSFAVFLPVREAPFVQIALGILYTSVAW